MRNKIIVLLFFCFLLHGCKLQYENRDYLTQKNTTQPIDTILLDTLIINNVNDQFMSSQFSIKPLADQICFKQIICNTTNDAFELNAMAGAGWVAPSFNKILYPPSCSKILYHFLAKNHEGRVNTSISITYKKKGMADVINKRITVTLIGWIEN